MEFVIENLPAKKLHARPASLVDETAQTLSEDRRAGTLSG